MDAHARIGRDECLLFDALAGGWRRFGPCRGTIVAPTAADVGAALAEADACCAAGRWVAGFVSYEAAPGFDACLTVRSAVDGLPAAWFGIYDEPVASRLPPPPAAPLAVAAWTPTADARHHRASVAAIRGAIAEGDVYQVNHTLRLTAPWSDPWPLFLQLAAAQPTPHAAYLDAGRWVLASVSPELFFAWHGGRITCRPMKGTRRRGRWSEEDRAAAAGLTRSAKDRAENVMIVDMVRNDLGRLATPGTVRASRLFRTEGYPTVWQLTSTVGCASTVEGVAPIFAALFPAASITGAPKAAAMRIIADREADGRGVYTGAIGFAGPGRQACFNVAIRTVTADRASRRLVYGSGGGIVWDSSPDDEWDECLAKTRVLSQPALDMPLLETLLWNGTFPHLDDHLARLAESSARFGRRLDLVRVAQSLVEASTHWEPAPRRVRLIVEAGGRCSVSSGPLQPLPSPYRLGLAAAPVDPGSTLLYHKTTRRAVYEAAAAGRSDCEDALLWNPSGEVTESCIANLLFEADGAWWTPPISCGLLPGTARRRLLAAGAVRERVLPVADLKSVRRLELVNAVRGRWPVQLA